MKMVALIPARAGSKRCPGKNTRELAGHPLIAYTVRAALDSGVFQSVTIATDIAADELSMPLYPNEPISVYRRSPASDDQPDIEWVREVFTLRRERPEAFAILRPTSPFRTAATIRRAYYQFASQRSIRCGP
jgi:CMP-N,N'-diacetyllegionaminic acid synthase